ncbi:MAG: flagellar motor switch protein FliN [Planctomycetia bacterium]
MAGDDNLNQDDIENLLSGNQGGGGESEGEANADAPPPADDAAPPADDTPPAAEDTPPPAEEAAGDSGDAEAQDDNQTLGQDDIEAVLKEAQSGGGTSAPTPEPPSAAAELPDIDKMLGQNEIEDLLKGAMPQENAGAGSPQPAMPHPMGQESTSKTVKHIFPEDGTINEGDVEYLLDQAEQAIDSIRNGSMPDNLPEGVKQFSFERFGGSTASSDMATLDLVKDVDLDLRIELGRTHMYLQDVLKLRSGSVVPLDKLAGDPVDIFVNGRLIAKGEVLVLNDNFCVRIGELIAGAEAAG